MSELRNQLQNARQQHTTLRYPGDLAADVLAPRIGWKTQFRIGISVAAGIAAVLLLILWLGRTSSPPPVTVAEIPVTNPSEETLPALAFTIERPADAQLTAETIETIVPTFSTSSIPAVWGFPTPSSIQEELSSQTQTEEEAS